MSGNDEFITENHYTNVESVLEALFFAAGDPVTITDAAAVLMMSKEETQAACDRLAAKINERNGGMILRKINDSYQFSTRPELIESLRKYFERPVSQTLSRAASETLAVVAYMQPVTRNVIESVRGVNSDSPLARLIERGLVEEAGRSDAPGRPMLYVTTDHFLRSCGLSSLDELPKPSLSEENEPPEQMNIFNEEKD